MFETIFAWKIKVPPSGRATLVMAKVAKTIAARQPAVGNAPGGSRLDVSQPASDTALSGGEFV